MIIKGCKLAIVEGAFLRSGFRFESLEVNKTDERIAVLLLSEVDRFVLRAFLLALEEDGYFHMNHELEAFSFKSRQDLEEFRDNLPSMTALELLCIMNTTPEKIKQSKKIF